MFFECLGSAGCLYISVGKVHKGKTSWGRGRSLVVCEWDVYTWSIAYTLISSRLREAIIEILKFLYRRPFGIALSIIERRTRLSQPTHRSRMKDVSSLF